MRIIEQGFSGKKVLWRCTSCHSVIEADMTEGIMYKNHNGSAYFAFPCPSCQKHHQVDIEK